LELQHFCRQVHCRLGAAGVLVVPVVRADPLGRTRMLTATMRAERVVAVPMPRGKVMVRSAVTATSVPWLDEARSVTGMIISGGEGPRVLMAARCAPVSVARRAVAVLPASAMVAAGGKMRMPAVSTEC
jgi:hypothetical protein